MATASLGKTSRIDIRMSSEQKRQIEEAAALNGLSVSQWSLGQLLASAREQILASSTIRLSAEAFDEFVRMLDEPADPAFVSLLDEEVTWQE